MNDSGLPLDTLANTIKAHIAAGDKAAGKADEHYMAAGKYLLEAKAAVKKTNGLTWPAFLAGRCQLQRSRADELCAVAEGTTTLEILRERKRTSVAKSRADNLPLRSGKSSEKTQGSQSSGNENQREKRKNGADIVSKIMALIEKLTPEQRFTMCADAAISLASFEFKGEMTEDVYWRAVDAARAWTTVARQMSEVLDRESIEQAA